MQAGASVPSYSGGLSACIVVSYPSISIHFSFQFFLQSAFSFQLSALSSFSFQLSTFSFFFIQLFLQSAFLA
jgi:hypothetical protein